MRLAAVKVATGAASSHLVLLDSPRMVMPQAAAKRHVDDVGESCNEDDPRAHRKSPLFSEGRELYPDSMGGK